MAMKPLPTEPEKLHFSLFQGASPMVSSVLVRVPQNGHRRPKFSLVGLSRPAQEGSERRWESGYLLLEGGLPLTSPDSWRPGGRPGGMSPQAPVSQVPNLMWSPPHRPTARGPSRTQPERWLSLDQSQALKTQNQDRTKTSIFLVTQQREPEWT